MKYYITVLVRDDLGHEDYHLPIAEFDTLKESIDFAKKTLGEVEVVGIEYNDDTKDWDDTGEHIVFVDGEQHYLVGTQLIWLEHDEG